jgi:MOSC domain-containing protein YiiM
MRIVGEARLEAGRGLVGDRYSRLDGERQVTLIEAEALTSIASHLGVAGISPEAVRRNLVTEGVNLLALKERRFLIGEAILETTGECHPCSRMEETLGIGGYSAVRGLGGITARVVTGGGLIRIGDRIERLDTTAADAV